MPVEARLSGTTATLVFNNQIEEHFLNINAPSGMPVSMEER